MFATQNRRYTKNSEYYTKLRKRKPGVNLKMIQQSYEQSKSKQQFMLTVSKTTSRDWMKLTDGVSNTKRIQSSERYSKDNQEHKQQQSGGQQHFIKNFRERTTNKPYLNLEAQSPPKLQLPKQSKLQIKLKLEENARKCYKQLTSRLNQTEVGTMRPQETMRNWLVNSMATSNTQMHKNTEKQLFRASLEQDTITETPKIPIPQHKQQHQPVTAAFFGKSRQQEPKPSKPVAENKGVSKQPDVKTQQPSTISEIANRIMQKTKQKTQTEKQPIKELSQIPQIPSLKLQSKLIHQEPPNVQQIQAIDRSEISKPTPKIQQSNKQRQNPQPTRPVPNVSVPPSVLAPPPKAQQTSVPIKAPPSAPIIQKAEVIDKTPKQPKKQPEKAKPKPKREEFFDEQMQELILQKYGSAQAPPPKKQPQPVVAPPRVQPPVQKPPPIKKPTPSTLNEPLVLKPMKQMQSSNPPTTTIKAPSQLNKQVEPPQQQVIQLPKPKVAEVKEEKVEEKKWSTEDIDQFTQVIFKYEDLINVMGEYNKKAKVFYKDIDYDGSLVGYYVYLKFVYQRDRFAKALSGGTNCLNLPNFTIPDKVIPLCMGNQDVQQLRKDLLQGKKVQSELQKHYQKALSKNPSLPKPTQKDPYSLVKSSLHSEYNYLCELEKTKKKGATTRKIQIMQLIFLIEFFNGNFIKEYEEEHPDTTKYLNRYTGILNDLFN